MTSARRVLIADDDPAIVDALTMILEDEGYEVEGTSGSDTLDHVVAWSPHLLFLDMRMPGMNGREIRRQLKQREATRRTHIIMLSASRDVEAIADAAGANGYLAKPFEMNDVLDVVENCTQHG